MNFRNKFSPLILVAFFWLGSIQEVGAKVPNNHNSGNDIDSGNEIDSANGVLANTNLEVGFRLRHEQVAQGKQSAHANTVKLRVSSKSLINEHWQVEIELDHVQALSDDHHSDGVLANGQLVIADPEGTELNQIFIDAKFDLFKARLGRQKIAYSDQRFIGSVDFRQNDQTFDGLSLNIDLFTSSQLDYAFINNVNRIFGDDASSHLSPEDSRFEVLAGIRPAALQGNHELEGHLINFSVKEWDYLELNSYFYSVNNQTLPSFSNQTQGIRAEFQKQFNRVRLLANLELAAQKQQKSAIEDWIGYSMFEFGARYQRFQLTLRQELLNQKNGQAFITPLATLHKFNGWSDQFLVTPDEGLNDRLLRLQWKKRPITVDLRYHRYSTRKNATPLGSEINIDLIYSPARKHEVRIRYADFEADHNQQIIAASVKKLFLIYTYNL